MKKKKILMRVMIMTQWKIFNIRLKYYNLNNKNFNKSFIFYK